MSDSVSSNITKHDVEELSQVNQVAQSYYDLQDTDVFYQKVSGGEHVHIGIFEHEDEDLDIAKERTVEYMASLVEISPDQNILDLGAGYGGTARYLSKQFNCPVTCLNISLKQNKINRERNHLYGLDKLITVVDGTFDNLDFEDNVFDLLWSQDAIFHSETPEKVFQEANRVLKESGEFVFSTVILNEQISEIDKEHLTRFYSLNLQKSQTYRDLAKEAGWRELQCIDLSSNIAINYGRLLSKMEALYSQDPQLWSQEFFEKMKGRLNDWVEAGQKGLIHWVIFHFLKDASITTRS